MSVFILVQFLLESILTALLGGLAGLFVGIISIMVGESLMGWQLAFTWISLASAFLISLTLSLIFGVYPAFIATKLNPVIVLQSQ